MNNQFVVEAHVVGSSVKVRSATLGTPSISFGNETAGIPSVTYPSVGLLNSNKLILTYIDTSHNINCRIGHLRSDGGIQWYSGEYPVPTDCQAASCSIAVNDLNEVAVVLQKYNTHDLYYMYGILDDDLNQISWGSAHKYDTGLRPSVAINSAGFFLEVHQSENHNSIYYNLATAGGGLITIRDNDEYKGGVTTPSITPCIAMNASGQVLEVHSASSNNSLYYMQFQVNTHTFKLEGPVCEQLYSRDSDGLGMGGTNPIVALNDNGDAVQICLSTTGGHLYGCTSRIWDRSNWMKDYQNKSLGQLSIPGSHDAAMSQSNDCYVGASTGNTKTQIKSIADQLDVGIRYFDIRPAFDLSSDLTVCEYRTGHFSNTPVGIKGCFGEAMIDVLTSTQHFLAQNQTEVVVLKFSHFYVYGHESGFFKEEDPSDEPSTDLKQRLITNLMAYIGYNLGTSYVFHNTSGTRLADLPLSSCAGKAIIVFDISELHGVSLTSGIYTYLDLLEKTGDDDHPVINTHTKQDAHLVVFDRYSNTNDISLMISKTAPADLTNPTNPGQEWQLMQTDYHNGDLFLLSWTLTLSDSDSLNPFTYDILELSQEATGRLAHEMVSMYSNHKLTGPLFPNVLYVDAADGFATDVAVWLNSMELR
jgi:hypothetical protein